MGNEYDRIIWGTGLLLRTAEDDERHHCLWTITTHPAATHHHKQSNARSLPSSVTITRERDEDEEQWHIDNLKIGTTFYLPLCTCAQCLL